MAHNTIDNKTASNRADEYSVYEVNNTDRVLNNLRIMIEDLFAKKFGGGDSVMIFNVNGVKLKKYGNAIHRDQDIVYF